MHPHMIGHRSRLSPVEELIEYIRGHDGVWFATHEDVARYCLARTIPVQPSTMDSHQLTSLAAS